MRTVVAGAAGWLGAHACRRLLADGGEVVALVERHVGADDPRAQALRQAGATVARTDLRDAPALRRHVRDSDALVNMARAQGLRRGSAWGSAARATQVVLELARELRVPRVVHVGCSRSPASRHVVEATVEPLQRRGLPVVVASPDVVYGPADPGPVGRMLDRLARGRLPLLPTGGEHGWTHVEDAAGGIAAALRQGKPGFAYALTGPVHTLREAATVAASHLGRRPPVFVPSAVHAPMRWLESVAETLPSGPFWDAELAALAHTSCAPQDGLAHEHLGWSPRPLEQGLRETLAAR